MCVACEESLIQGLEANPGPRITIKTHELISANELVSNIVLPFLDTIVVIPVLETTLVTPVLKEIIYIPIVDTLILVPIFDGLVFILILEPRTITFVPVLEPRVIMTSPALEVVNSTSVTPPVREQAPVRIFNLLPRF